MKFSMSAFLMVLVICTLSFVCRSDSSGAVRVQPRVLNGINNGGLMSSNSVSTSRSSSQDDGFTALDPIKSIKHMVRSV